MTPQEQIAQLEAECTPQTNLSSRAVGDGYVLTGTLNYVNKKTKIIDGQRSCEAVAMLPEHAASLASRFILTCSFDEPTA